MHYHKDPKGTLVRCFHVCKSTLLDWKFWLGITASFPLEHFIWEKVWPFYIVTKLLGL